MLGDFNVDYRKRDDINFKRFQTFFKKFGLTQLIENITRPCINSGSCIDWIVTNSRFVASSGVTTVYLSDHFVIECVCKKSREKKSVVYRNLRNYSKYNRENLIDILKNRLDSDQFDAMNDPNTLWNCIYRNTLDILSVMCPIKRYSQRETPSPWISAEIYRAIRYRDTLISLYNTAGALLYLTLAKRQRNHVNMLIESAKKKYVESLLTKNVKTPKNFGNISIFF